MKTYARAESGKVVEIVSPITGADGLEIPIAERFHPDFIALLFDVTDVPGIAVGYIQTADGFRAPLQPPVPTLDDIRKSALAQIRVQRAPMLDALDGIAGRADRKGDAATATAADAAAQGLLDITALPAFLAAQTYDSMKAAIVAEYKRLAASAPEAVQAVFREVLS